MIFGFLSDLLGSIVILSIVFLAAIILEYKYNLIGNAINYVNPFIKIQGFTNPSSSDIYDPMGIHENTKYSPGNAFSASTEKLLSDFVPVLSDSEAQNAWSKIPSQSCLKYDDGEKLKPLANYYQRTNNYMRTNPDDCSAPFHEMLGTFYSPSLGVGRTAPSGIPLPGSVVSCDGAKSDIVGNSSRFTESISE